MVINILKRNYNHIHFKNEKYSEYNIKLKING